MTFNLRTRIFLVFIGLVVFSSVINIGIAGFAVKKNLTADLINRIVINTKSEIGDLTNFVLIKDKGAILDLIFNQKASNRDIAYLMVLDEENQVIVSTFINKNTDLIRTSNLLEQGKDEVVTLIKQDDGTEVYDVALSLNYNIGTLRVGYYKKQIDESVSSVINLLILGLIFAIFTALFFAFIFTKSLLKPLDNLKGSVQKLASGDLSVRANVETKDEFGFLAESFNVMAVKLHDLYSSMDQKIKDKTVALSNQVREVEKSKSAILNLLEDINNEKNNAEQIVIKRTKELRDEKARLLASINSLSFGFIIADKNDTILLKNPALTKILELGDDLKSIQDIADSLRVNAKSIEAFDPVLSCKKCMELRQVIEIKNVLYGKKFLRLLCAPVFDDKEVNGYVFLIEDITEAKVMERSRDEFFAVASHELRTPLTAIRGNADMILDSFANNMTDPEVKEMLNDINTSSLRLIDIVNDFLEVSRIEQGKLDLKIDTFNLQDLLNKVIKDLKTIALKKGVHIINASESLALPSVRADKNRIEEVLINLIGNALKFTEKGSITISAEVDNNFVRVRVVDTGLGISEQNQSRLFRKFQQAGENMIARDVTQGTGLGLYISQLLMSQMGGTIGLEKSSLGQGSTFVFTVPVVL